MVLLHDLLRGSAERHPDKTALVYGKDAATYAELWTGVTRVSAALREMGLEPGDRVGIYLPKCIDELVTIFAVAHAGGIFVDISPALDAPAVGHILKDSSVSAVITSSAGARTLGQELANGHMRFAIFTDRIPEGAPDGARTTTLGACREFPPRAASADGNDERLASIIYTSGSTGSPKGVMLTHRNIVLGAESVSAYLENTASDVILSLLPFSFDYGFNQATTCFRSGATLVLQKFLFPEDVIRTVAARRITGLAGIPTLWTQILRAKNVADSDTSSLRYLTNSGGHLSSELIARLRGAFPTARIFPMYGLTEAFRSTYLKPELIDQRPGSIGKAVPHVDIFVVNEQGMECAPGELGELVHGGPLVSKGYWQREEDTRRIIRTHPYDSSYPWPVCHSGDLVKKDEEGFLYFVARMDAMIKSSGYRISPEEIETRVSRHEHVEFVVATGIPDEELGQRIRIIVSPKPGVKLDEATLRAHCAAHMPRYMVPHSIVIVDEMPLGPSGKIARSVVTARHAGG